MNENLNVLKDGNAKYQGGNFGIDGYLGKPYVYYVKENGITRKKYLSMYSSVDFIYINSQEYKQKFMNITDNDLVNTQLYRCAVAMLTHRNNSKMEDMYLIDSITGKIVGSQTSCEILYKVNYNNNMKKAILNSDEYSLISIHNHPTNVPPTGGDFTGAFNNKYKFGIVVCHNGDVYYYKVGNKQFLGYMFDKSVENLKARGYNEYDAFEQTLNRFIKNYDIEWRRL